MMYAASCRRESSGIKSAGFVSASMTTRAAGFTGSARTASVTASIEEDESASSVIPYSGVDIFAFARI